MDFSSLSLGFCLFFTSGVLAGSKLSFTPLLGFFLSSVFSLLVFLTLFLKEKKIFLALFFLFSAFLGLLRIDLAQKSLARPEFEPYFGKKVKVKAELVSEPEVLDYKKSFQVFIPSLKARARVTSSLYPPLHVGDEVRLEGKLKKPPSEEEFDYEDYLKRKKVYFLLSFPQIEVLKRKKDFSLKRSVVLLREGMERSLERVSSFPEAGFFKALLFGSEEGIPYSWREKLNKTGTRHIVAISGANITIVSSMVLSFLLSLGLWRGQALWASFLFITLYVFMIGAPPSGVRAGVMGALLLFAQRSGRVMSAKRVSLLTLFFMLFLSPLLVFDVGFKLSFLAFSGLVFLAPLLKEVFKKVPNVLGLRENLSSTLAAQVFAFPVLASSFGTFSLVSPLANILILPFLPFLTVCAFVFSFVGLFSKFLARLIYIPSSLLLTLVMEVIEVFSRVPFASVKMRLPSFLVPLLYVFLFTLFFLKEKKEYFKV